MSHALVFKPGSVVWIPCELAEARLADLQSKYDTLGAETMTTPAKQQADAAPPLSKQITELVRENVDLRARLAEVAALLEPILTGEFHDLDPDDGLHTTSARRLVKAALAKGRDGYDARTID